MAANAVQANNWQVDLKTGDEKNISCDDGYSVRIECARTGKSQGPFKIYRLYVVLKHSSGGSGGASFYFMEPQIFEGSECTAIGRATNTLFTFKIVKLSKCGQYAKFRIKQGRKGKVPSLASGMVQGTFLKCQKRELKWDGFVCEIRSDAPKRGKNEGQINSISVRIRNSKKQYANSVDFRGAKLFQESEFSLSTNFGYDITVSMPRFTDDKTEADVRVAFGASD